MNKRNIWRTHTTYIKKCLESCTDKKQDLAINRMISNSFSIMINSGYEVQDCLNWQRAMFSIKNEYFKKPF